MHNPQICRSHAIKCGLLAKEADEFSYKLLVLSIAELWGVIAQTSEAVGALDQNKIGAALRVGNAFR
jgi:hypothetical protein